MTGVFVVAIIIPRSPVPGTVSGPVQVLSAHQFDELNKSMIKPEPHYNPVGATRIVPMEHSLENAGLGPGSSRLKTGPAQLSYDERKWRLRGRPAKVAHQVVTACIEGPLI